MRSGNAGSSVVSGRGETQQTGVFQNPEFTTGDEAYDVLLMEAAENTGDGFQRQTQIVRHVLTAHGQGHPIYRALSGQL